MHIGNGMKYLQNSNGRPTFLTMPDSTATLPTVFDVGRLPEFNMADSKPKVHCI